MSTEIQSKDEDDDTDDEESIGGNVEGDRYSPVDLGTDDIIELLGTGRRRLVLEYMADETGGIDVPDLVDYVHTHEDDPSSWKATYVALHQVHLPTLAEADVIVYDQDDRTVYLGENGKAVIAVQEGITETVRLTGPDGPDGSDGSDGSKDTNEDDKSNGRGLRGFFSDRL